MSTVNYTSVEPGQVVSASDTNDAFDAFATGTADLNASNYRNDCFDTNNLVKSDIIPASGTVENTVGTAKTYTGTSYQLVDTNAVDMTTGNITAEDGDYLVVHWRQLLTEMTANTRSLDHRVRFELYWRITGSAVYVQVPNTPVWAYSGYNWIKNALHDQNICINCAGSVAIQIASNILITGLELRVKPGTNALDEVDLAQGSLSYMLFRR